jgi:hypothetical protein
VKPLCHKFLDSLETSSRQSLDPVIPQTARDADNAKSRGKQALPTQWKNVEMENWKNESRRSPKGPFGTMVFGAVPPLTGQID